MTAEPLPTRGTIHETLDRDLGEYITTFTVLGKHSGTLLAVGQDTIRISDDQVPCGYGDLAIRHLIGWQRAK